MQRNKSYSLLHVVVICRGLPVHHIDFERAMQDLVIAMFGSFGVCAFRW